MYIGSTLSEIHFAELALLWSYLPETRKKNTTDETKVSTDVIKKVHFESGEFK